MTSWEYFHAEGETRSAHWVKAHQPEDIQTVGRRELEMLLRARRSSSKSVVIQHTKERNRERLALRRLCERGLFSWPNAFGGLGVGWLYRYNLTEDGQTVWLRYR